MEQEQWQVAAEAREFTRGNKPLDPEPHRHAGLVGDNQIRELLTGISTHYEPAQSSADMPAQAHETRLYNMILRKESTETLTRSVHAGNLPTQSYFVGDPGARSDISGIKAIGKINDTIIQPAPIVYIFGEPGSGKTNIALLLAQLWKMEHPEGEVVTNIRTLEQKDKWVKNYPELKEWADESTKQISGGGITQKDDAKPGLFIFDEASSHAAGRGEDGYEANQKLSPLLYKLRKSKAGLVIIGHDGKDVIPSVRTLSTVIRRYKGEYKRGTIFEDVNNREGRGKIAELTGIPETDWNYDDKEATSWSWTKETQDEDEKMTKEQALSHAGDLAEEMTKENVKEMAARLCIADNGMTQNDIGEVLGNAHRGEPFDQRTVSVYKSEYESEIN